MPPFQHAHDRERHSGNPCEPCRLHGRSPLMISEDCFSCDRPTYLDNLSGNISLQGLHLLSAGPATTHKAPHAPQAFLKAFRQDGLPPGGALDTMPHMMRHDYPRRCGLWPCRTDQESTSEELYLFPSEAVFPHPASAACYRHRLETASWPHWTSELRKKGSWGF